MRPFYAEHSEIFLCFSKRIAGHVELYGERPDVGRRPLTHLIFMIRRVQRLLKQFIVKQEHRKSTNSSLLKLA